MRRLLLLALAVCGLAHAEPPPHLELVATPAWKGWTRHGRPTEVEIRLSADTATRAAVELVAGRRTVHAGLDLEPRRVARLHVPVGPAESVAASVRLEGAPLLRRDIELAQSESPLLGVGLSADDDFRLEGFHSIALSASDLPRNASAFATVDALVLDATTLATLEPRQLDALLGHAAACGRIVVLNADDRLRQLLQGAGGCGERALMIAASLPQARRMLKSSLAARLPSPASLGSVGELARPGLVVWNRVAVLLAACFAVAILAAVMLSSWPLLLLTPAVLSAAVLGALHVMRPPSQLLVWGEGESGAQVARYQAWQRFPGVVRERARVPIPGRLAASVGPCDADQAMRLELDPNRGHAASAEFDNRLFGQVALCYSGSFPMTRAMALRVRPDGSSVVRNEGPTAWPDGLLLAGGLVHGLPKLGPGAGMAFGPGTGRADRSALVRTATMRLPPDRGAALWPLELAGVVDATVESRGWLLLTATPRP